MRILVLSLSRCASTAVYYDILSALPADSVGDFEPEANKLLTQPIPDNGVVKLILDEFDCASWLDLRSLFDQTIVLIREPRDRLISSMLFAIHGVAEAEFARRMSLLEAKQQSPSSVSFLELIQQMFPDWTQEKLRMAILHQFDVVNHIANDVPASLHLKYENYVAHGISAIAPALHLPTGACKSIPEHHNYGKRRVQSGDWRNWFTEQDVTFFQPLLSPFLNKHGYPDDWQLNSSPDIPVQHSTEFVRAAHEKDRYWKSQGQDWRNRRTTGSQM